MCGIFCSINRDGFVSPDAATKKLLQNRGPDSIGQREMVIGTNSCEDVETPLQLHATFLSTVLSLRGKTVVTQPLQNAESGSILCWNGEAWTIGSQVVAGNDSQLIFDKLVAISSSADSVKLSIRAVTALLSTVKGPYAFVFYDAPHKLVYYGRDCLGRRSLLRKSTSDHLLVLSSVCDNANGESWTEVEADGIYVVNLSSVSSTQPVPSFEHVPHRLSSQEEGTELSFVGKSLAVQSLLTSVVFAISSPGSQHPQ
jgi:asparagine synthetase B (glutamine-hydrolysing)